MSDVAMIETCFTCGSRFQMGAHVYDGKYIPRYQMSVCKGCYDGNWDGWSPRFEKKIIKNLETNGLDIPERLANGLLPRE